MSQPVSTGNDSPRRFALRDEFIWSGSLEQTDIRSVYERCQRLRLTGRMELSDTGRSTELVFFGGQPVEQAGQDTQQLLLWEHGEFLVTQRIPDFDGTLRDGIETSGALAPGKVQQISELCADHRLSADVLLMRAAGGAALVRFTYGKAESATVDEQPVMALQALSLLAYWKDGVFRIRLRPLFGDEAPAEAPIIVEKETGRGSFDVTGAIPIPSLWDDSRRPSRPMGKPAAREEPAVRRPMEPSVEIHLSPSYAEILAMSEAEAAANVPSAASVRPVFTPAGPVKEGVRAGGDARRGPPKRSPWGRAFWVGLIGGGAAFLAIWAVRMALPRLRQGALAPGITDQTGQAGAGRFGAVRQEGQEGRPSTAPSAVTQAPAPNIAPPHLVAPPPPVAPKPPPHATPRERSREVRALVERAQRMIVEGRMKKAQEVLLQAQGLSPEDEGLSALLRQARGELGRGELVLSGHGSLTINGRRFEAPRKLRLPAGSYVVNGREVEVKDGEQLHVEP